LSENDSELGQLNAQAHLLTDRKQRPHEQDAAQGNASGCDAAASTAIPGMGWGGPEPSRKNRWRAASGIRKTLEKNSYTRCDEWLGELSGDEAIDQL
jgi:hypothetical protein